MKKIFDKVREEDGIGNMLTVMYILPILFFLATFNVPILAYHVKHDKLLTISNLGLKEAEAVGYVSDSIKLNTIQRLEALNLGPVTVNGVNYPDFTGSTSSKVLRDSHEPTVIFAVKYPAPRLDQFIGLIGGERSSGSTGFTKMVKFGRSEAYE